MMKKIYISLDLEKYLRVKHLKNSFKAENFRQNKKKNNVKSDQFFASKFKKRFLQRRKKNNKQNGYQLLTSLNLSQKKIYSKILLYFGFLFSKIS